MQYKTSESDNFKSKYQIVDCLQRVKSSFFDEEINNFLSASQMQMVHLTKEKVKLNGCQVETN